MNDNLSKGQKPVRDSRGRFVSRKRIPAIPPPTAEDLTPLRDTLAPTPSDKEESSIGAVLYALGATLAMNDYRRKLVNARLTARTNYQRAESLAAQLRDKNKQIIALNEKVAEDAKNITIVQCKLSDREKDLAQCRSELTGERVNVEAWKEQAYKESARADKWRTWFYRVAALALFGTFLAAFFVVSIVK